MKHNNLWAPWRFDYVSRVPDQPESACFLCDAAARPDQSEMRLVLHRDDRGMLLLNRYPYTNGHLLATVADHLPDLPNLSPGQRAGLMELTVLGEEVLRACYNPHGINIGINIGRCAGAGLPGHLHAHIVPRWNGDTNFMDVVGQVRVIPQALERVYADLRNTLERMGTAG